MDVEKIEVTEEQLREAMKFVNDRNIEGREEYVIKFLKRLGFTKYKEYVVVLDITPENFTPIKKYKTREKAEDICNKLNSILNTKVWVVAEI